MIVVITRKKNNLKQRKKNLSNLKMRYKMLNFKFLALAENKNHVQRVLGYEKNRDLLSKSARVCVLPGKLNYLQNTITSATHIGGGRRK